MNNKIKTKAFAKVIGEIHLSYDKLAKILADKRLTSTERKIIQCWHYLRKGQSAKILETLKNTDADYDNLVMAQKDLLTGIAYIWEGNLNQALILIKNASFMLSQYEDIGNVHFLALYNYFICSINLKNRKEVELSLALLADFPKKDEKQSITYLNCVFNYHSFCNEHVEAEKTIKLLDPLKKKMNDSIFMAYSTGKYIHFVKTEQFEKCYQVLEERKKRRSFYSRANYLFMRVLLDNYCKHIPIYAYQKDFKDSPFLFWQIMVIKCLEEKNPYQAQKYWDKLRLSMPNVYKRDFEYLGPKDIFSLCLKLHQQPVELEDKTVLPEKKEEALLYLLSKSKTSVTMDTIYQHIWGEEIVDKDDINKLKKLVSRVRKNKDVDIKYKKGCYYLDNKENKDKKAS